MREACIYIYKVVVEIVVFIMYCASHDLPLSCRIDDVLMSARKILDGLDFLFDDVSDDLCQSFIMYACVCVLP